MSQNRVSSGAALVPPSVAVPQTEATVAPIGALANESPRSGQSRRRRYLRVCISSVAIAVVAAALPAFAGDVSASPSVNLVPDPALANGTGAWTVTAGAGLTVVDGHAGNSAIRITNSSGAAKTANLNDKVNTVGNTVAGTTYTASAWVRVSAPGMSVGIREGEWAGTTSKATPKVTEYVTTDRDWHYISVAYTAVSSGATIDLNVLAWQLPNGNTLDVSEPSLTSAAAPAAPAPAPTPAPTQLRPSGGTTYTKLAFDDEFTGSTLRSVWNVNKYALPYELSENTPNDISVRDGNLIVAAKKERTPSGRSWSSGYIDTRGGKFAQKYGFFEARIQLPTTAGNSLGLWPAWWLRPDNGKSGEVDIMEAWGEGPNSPRSDYRPGSAEYTIIADTGALSHGKKSNWWTAAGSPRLSDGFHTFAVQWTPSGFTFYLDGKAVADYPNGSLGFPISNFDAKFHLRLQMQVGQANYWGVPNSSTKSYAEMKVDWVRVWTK